MNKYLAAIIFVLIGGGAVVLTGAVLNKLAVYQQPQHAQANGTASGPSGTMKHVSVSLQAFPQGPDSLPQWEAEHNYKLIRPSGVPVLDAHQDWVTYGPSTNIVVPANSEVTMTITNYDSGGSLLNDFYANVRGTINNQITINGQTATRVAADNVSHTFTIHGDPSSQQPWLFVNVPLVKNNGDLVTAGADNGLVKDPIVETFSFYVGGPGHYVWQCEYPCGTYYNGFGGPMSTNGYMNGTFDVVG
ncbi:MAG TPA: hypothetical protein VJN88_04180 [Ktedonobacterales bacterium]|nr:hypothetical protein [Ktedonobacterales bacterium]